MVSLFYLARHWPGGARLRWPLAKGATFASCAVPMALRAVWETDRDSAGQLRQQLVEARIRLRVRLQRLLHAGHNVREAAIEQQRVAELPGEDGFEKNTPGPLGSARIVWIDRLEPRLHFGSKRCERRPAGRSNWRDRTCGRAARLQARGPLGHLPSDDLHHLV